MTPLENAIPLRWPSGPLEIARREKQNTLTQQAREILERWHQPEALEILKGTPVDCLVLSWAAGLPADARQQQTARALVDAARRRGLAVVGWVESEADPRAAMASAISAGLSAIAAPNFRGEGGIPVIPWGNRAAAPWDSTAPVLPVADNVWPGVAATGGGAGDAAAGPTSVPWLDSNAWYIQLARARTTVPLWLMFDPPGKGVVVTAQSYLLALCDTEAAGARWVISLDDTFRAGLAGQDARSIQTWKQMGDAVAFFQKHGDWRRYHPLGLVGVISDFAGDNFNAAGEILNLMARRDLLFRAIWKSRASNQAFAGLKAILYADGDQPAPELKQKLMTFAEEGGMLIAGPTWAAAGKPSGGDAHARFDVRAVGKGRLALAREAMTDPYQLAGDTQILLSHANDLVKLYNGASSGCTHYTGSADGARALLQVLTYASGRQTGRTTVWLWQKHRSVNLWSLTAAAPTPIAMKPADEFPGFECPMPEGSSQNYLALELES